MSLVAALPSDFLVCPPLEHPLRLAFEVGFFGAPRVNGRSGGDCCGDRFASVNPDGSAGLHQIHEAVDLASGAGSCVYAAYSGTIVIKEAGNLVIDRHVQLNLGTYATCGPVTIHDPDTGRLIATALTGNDRVIQCQSSKCR